MNDRKIDVQKLKQDAHGIWANILARCGISSEFLIKGKHCPCPICGGTDRYKFDDKTVDLTYFCNNCGHGDGINLLVKTHNISFYDALTAVYDLLNNNTSEPIETRHIRANNTHTQTHDRTNYIARKRALLRMKEYSTRTPSPEGIKYLNLRGLTGMADKRLNSIQYGNIYCNGENGRYIRRNGSTAKFPALIGFMSHWNEQPVSAVKIYLNPDEIRKHLPADYQFNHKQFFRKTTPEGLAGSAVWFTNKPTRILHVGEGIETMLAVAKFKKSRAVAACCTANNLANLVIPDHVERVYIWADLDKNGKGQEKALELQEKYKDKEVTILLPKGNIPDYKKGIDWLDIFANKIYMLP